ncbi:uncharacterized protein LOC131598464 [Vicia villosa]|uniref:uncharacterized protein LOC131598464 n=1 Tax=Vicia villosa TaxID=3911 RepID=UPI00273B81F8|nr:uncharacterized protein LOC131598464 [Vicia villosa]
MVRGMNDDVIAEALAKLAEAIGHNPQVNVNARNNQEDELRALGKFQRNNPPIFKGTHEPEKAHAWLKAIENIFRVMNCSEAPKVHFYTYMLEKEAEEWWGNTGKRFTEEGTKVSWVVFKEAFLEKYFPEHVHGKKEIEFLELKWGKGVVEEYATKFKELIKYCPHYNTADAERSKCLTFVNGKRTIQRKVICDSTDKGKQKASDGRSRVREELLLQLSVIAMVLKDIMLLSAQVPSRNFQAQYRGKVFSLAGSETTAHDGLIRGTCFINGTPLITIIDIGVTYSFIALDCAKRLNLELSDMCRSVVIDTPSMSSVTTSSMCLNCPLSIFGRNFRMNLMCLPLDQLDFILGMNWLEFNHIYINCFVRTINFPEFGDEVDLFMSAKQVKESVHDGAMRL